MKNGGEYEEAFEARFKRLGKRAYLWRITDLADIRGMNEIRMGGIKIKAPPAPSDYVVVDYELGMHYAEVKGTTNETSFPFSMIRPAQFSHARRSITAQPGSYFFYIFAVTHETWYRVPAEAILEETTKSSLTWEELSCHAWTT